MLLTQDQFQKTNPAFTKFHKLIRKNRVFKAIEEETGTHLEKQSQKNLLELYSRLRTSENLPLEIKKQIDQEKSHPNDVLTADEFNFFKEALAIPLIANHASYNAPAILKSDGYVYSSDELKRRKIEVNTHTPKGAQTDSVFLSYSLPEKINIVNFLGTADYFLMNLDKFAEKDPVGYSGMWTSGHLYAYEQEQSIKPIRYQSDKNYTQVNSYYRMQFNPTLTYSRHFIFNSAHQHYHFQLVRDQDISVGRHIKPYHLLRLIEYIRYLDPEIRTLILKHGSDQKLMAELFDSVFTPGKAELHAPCALQFQTKTDPETFAFQTWSHTGPKHAEILKECIINNDLATFEKLIHQSDKLSFSRFSHQHYIELSLLNLAVIYNRQEMVAHLLKKGADPDYVYRNPKQSIIFDCAKRTALQDAVEQNNFALVKLLCEPLQNTSTISTTFCASVTDIILYTAIADHLDEGIFKYLLDQYPAEQHKLNTLLMLAVYYKNIRAIELLIEAGANPNATLEVHQWNDDIHLVPSGLKGTTLTVAAQLGYAEIVKILIKLGAQVDTYVEEHGNYTKYGRGASPLITAMNAYENLSYTSHDSIDNYWHMDRKRYHQCKAEEKDFEEVISTLIAAGANVNYISGDNEQFFAKLKQYCINHPKHLFLNQLYQTLLKNHRNFLYTPPAEKHDEFDHEAFALITGKDENANRMLLIAEKDLNNTKYLTVPGGAIDYRLDKNSHQALINHIGYQIKLNLNQENEASAMLCLAEKSGVKNDFVNLYHYELNHPIADYSLYQNTIFSNKFSLERDQYTHLLTNIHWIPLKEVVIKNVNYKGINYPVCLYHNKPLPPFIALKIAALCGNFNYDNADTRALALDLFNDGYHLADQAVKTGDIKAMKSLIELGILHSRDYSNLLTDALEAKQYEMVLFLLEEGLLLSAENFSHHFCYFAKEANHPENIILALYRAHRHLFNDKNEIPGYDLAIIAGKLGYNTLLTELSLIKNGCLRIAAKSAFEHLNFTSLKLVLVKCKETKKQKIICDLLQNLCSIMANNPQKEKLIEITQYLLEIYDGKTKDRFTLKRLADLYKYAVELDFPSSIQSKCLEKFAQFLEINKPSLKDSNLIITYIYLCKEAKDEKNALKKKIVQLAADNYFNVISDIVSVKLEFAIYHKDFATVDLILNKHQNDPLLKNWLRHIKYSSLNTKDDAGRTCLQRAVKNNNYGIVKLLVENCLNDPSFDLEAGDKEGFSALQNAISFKHEDIAKLLIIHGANINELLIELAKLNNQNDLAQLMQTIYTAKQPEKQRTVDMKNYSLIISTESPIAEDNLAKTGDVDYAQKLASVIQQQTNMKVECCHTDTQIALEKKLKTDPENLVFHLMVNAPRTGCATPLASLEEIKKAGGKVIITAVEFAKHRETAYKLQTLNYLAYADQMIFLDEQDKKDAIQFAMKKRPELVDKIKTATISNVPPSIPTEYISTVKKAENIMCFGMLRRGKGFAHIMHLAELIQKSEEKVLKDKSIYVVGTVPKNKTRQHGTAYDPTLYQLLSRMYPDYATQFLNKSPQELADFYTAIQKAEIPAKLPIKLFLDVDKKDLAELFEQCHYAFYPAYRGVTLRNSSISTELAFGCVVYSHIGSATPACLKENGAYHQAMVLFPDDNYHTYAENVLQDLIVREKNHKNAYRYSFSPDVSMNDKTKAIAQQLLNLELSAEKIAEQHTRIYETVLSATSKAEKDNVAPVGIFGLFAAKDSTQTSVSLKEESLNLSM